MSKPIGGRGKKAPYLTTIMRVPMPIAEKVKSLIEGYRLSAINGQITQDDLRRIEPWHTPISKTEAIEKAREILTQKKSARISMQKLLQVLYDDLKINL